MATFPIPSYDTVQHGDPVESAKRIICPTAIKSGGRCTDWPMTFDGEGSIEKLDVEQCWELLGGASLGRLAMSVAGQPEIYPINFIAHDRKLSVRTAEGTKLLELTINSKVAFETDEVGTKSAWSVVVKGTARILEKQSEVERAEELPLLPLIPTLKYVWVEITPAEVTGRRFALGPEPDRY